jgi:hypothetical protein
MNEMTIPLLSHRSRTSTVNVPHPFRPLCTTHDVGSYFTFPAFLVKGNSPKT